MLPITLCRAIPHPVVKAVCWGTVYAGKTACAGMCYLYYCD